MHHTLHLSVYWKAYKIHTLCFTYMQRKMENQCIALACPITGSLSWWLCLTSRQTVIHMSVLWPGFHLEQFHRGHWKQKGSQVKDLNPCLASVAITTPRASPFIERKVYLCWLHKCCFLFIYLFPPSGLRGEWQRRIPINWLVTFPSSSVWLAVSVKRRSVY